MGLEYIFGSLDKKCYIYFYIMSIGVIILFIFLSLFLFIYPSILKPPQFNYIIVYICILFMMIFFQNQMIYNLCNDKMFEANTTLDDSDDDNGYFDYYNGGNMSTDAAYASISKYLDQIIKNTTPLQYITNINRINH